MLKTSAVTAVILMLGLPACTLAKPAENPQQDSHCERLPFTRVRDSLNQTDGKQPCEGVSVKEFLQGKCDKLKGFDSLQDVRNQSGSPRSGFKPFYEFTPIRRLDSFVKDAGGHAWYIHGDDGINRTNPLFQFTPRFYRRDGDGEFSKKSVDDFMQGKEDKLRGVDAIPHNLRMPSLPPAWGSDEFVKTDGFTQSGAPYQHVNPLYGIPLPQFDLSPKKEQAQPKN